MAVVKPFKCPDCSKRYGSKRGLKGHVDAVHKNKRHPCRYGCGADFCSRPAMERHAQTKHEDFKRFKCRGCTQTFTRERSARDHYQRVHVNPPKPYSCSFCGKKFQYLSSKDGHEKSHTEYACPRNSCYDGFKSIENALEHAKDPQHGSDKKLYRCPVENCRLTIIGKVIDKASLVKHWNMHVNQGHISGDLELVYIEAVQPPFRDIPILGSIMANNHSLLLADALLGNTVPEPQEDADEDADEDDQADEEEDQILVSADEEINILEHNTDWWESHRDHLVCYNARGYKCAGPALETRHFIIQGCPAGAIIDFDTALLRRSRGRRLPTLSLDSQCASCHSEVRVKQLIKRFDSPKLDLKGGLGALRQTFVDATLETWTCTEDYEQRVRQPVRQQLDQQVVIIDNEFNPITHELYETSIIDRVSGKSLLNTLIVHTEETKSTVSTQRTKGEKVDIISHLYKKKVYARSRGLARMNVHQVAKKLEESGITPDTIFLAWHVSRTDLKLLRDFLAKGGYHDILPEDTNCFPLIPLFRANVPKGFRLSLDIVYPVMFPGSDLCGLNHRAEIDCQQTLKICNSLDNFCEPVENQNEDWQQPTRVAKKAQRCILDYFAEGKR